MFFIKKETAKRYRDPAAEPSRVKKEVNDLFKKTKEEQKAEREREDVKYLKS